MVKDFLRNLKSYFDYIIKLNFGDLLIKFIDLVLVILMSLFVYIPVSLVRDLVYTIIGTFGNLSILSLIMDLLFKGISFVLCIYVFVYLFNKRYEDIKEERLNSREEVKKKIQEESFELPEMKQK